MRYFISQGLLRPALEVEIEGVPPCLFCGDPVTSPSMDGPLVCGRCDCGRNPDGSRWTEEQAEVRYAHRRSKVAEYRSAMIDRRIAEAKDLIAKMTKGPWNVRETYIETPACVVDVCDRDDAAFMALAHKLLPDLIERDELRGTTVTKWADASGVAKGERDRLRQEVRAVLKKLSPESIRELRELLDDPRRLCGGANQHDYEQRALRLLLVGVPVLLVLHDEISKLVEVPGDA